MRTGETGAPSYYSHAHANGYEMLFRSLHLKNVLSFKDAEVALAPLNVVIGPNASGKSNLIEALSLLQAVPDDLARFFRLNGPILDWIWKGDADPEATLPLAEITAVLENPEATHEAERRLTYILRLAANNERLQVVGEKLENISPYESYQSRPYYYFSVENGYGRIASRKSYNDEGDNDQGEVTDGLPRRLTPDNFAPTQSIMSQIRDPVNFPVLTQTSHRLSTMRLYRDWSVGRNSPARKPQGTDDDIDFLDEDFKNLALVVSDLQTRGLEALINDNLNRFYQAYDSLRPRVYGGTIQLAANETGMRSAIPATRLSDGTMRFIALLTILCHPRPPELICIEEPELAMHPDVMPLLADLLRSASERTQVIVTTHSPDLVDQFTVEPDAVVVCERGFDGGTQLKRLSSEELKDWLAEYRLGEMWQKGVIGGNRW